MIALANSTAGKDALFEKVRKKEIPAESIADPKVEERIMLNLSSRQRRVYKELTAHTEDVNKKRQAMIRKRIGDYSSLAQKPSLSSGHIIFINNCSPCHSIKGEGGNIGPQLDGVGKWGLTSLAQKILDPNRNISENFKNYSIIMKDGKFL